MTLIRVMKEPPKKVYNLFGSNTSKSICRGAHRLQAAADGLPRPHRLQHPARTSIVVLGGICLRRLGDGTLDAS